MDVFTKPNISVGDVFERYNPFSPKEFEYRVLDPVTKQELALRHILRRPGGGMDEEQLRRINEEAKKYGLRPISSRNDR